MIKIRYPYYTPNFGFRDLVQAFFISSSRAESALLEYFRKLTGKKYILITNSCRTALYLAWKCLDEKSEVITSPLTCKVAIDPINEAGQKVVYADISLVDLNLNVKSVAEKISPHTVGIQAIHLGGTPCKMDELKELATKHNLKIVEDCAQSLGASYKGTNSGSFGDISCFSLIKNGYGIGGGIFATDDELLYNKAIETARKFSFPSKILIFYRILKNMADSCRKYIPGRLLYNILLKIKGQRKSYNSVTGQLHQITSIEKKIAALQLHKYDHLHQKRKKVGNQYVSQLHKTGLVKNVHNSLNESSFTKFFVYHPKIKSHTHLNDLRNVGLDAMHLEQRAGNPVQDRLVSEMDADAQGLINYNKVHDHIISLPVCEWFKQKHVVDVVETLKKFTTK